MCGYLWGRAVFILLFWAYWIYGSLVFILYFGKFLAIIYFKYFFSIQQFFFLIVLIIPIFISFDVTPHFLNDLLCSTLLLIFYCSFLSTLVWEVSVLLCSSSPILSLAVSSLQMSSCSPSSLLLYFWFLVFPFDPFLAFLFLCLRYSCLLSTFSVRTLNKWIIVLWHTLIIQHLCII